MMEPHIMDDLDILVAPDTKHVHHHHHHQVNGPVDLMEVNLIGLHDEEQDTDSEPIPSQCNQPCNQLHQKDHPPLNIEQEQVSGHEENGDQKKIPEKVKERDEVDGKVIKRRDNNRSGHGFFEDLLECSVCFEQLDMTSKVLPCQHTFCKHCLESIVNSHKELRCPECRILVQVGIHELPNNILLIRLLEGIRNQKSSTSSPKESGSSKDHHKSGRMKEPSSHQSNHHPGSSASRPNHPFRIGHNIFDSNSGSNHPLVNLDTNSQHHRQFSDPSATRSTMSRVMGEPCMLTPSNPRARALFHYEASNPGDISFKKGDIIIVKNRINNNWIEGQVNGVVGFLPSSYIQMLPHFPPSQETATCRALYDFDLTSSHQTDKNCLKFCKNDLIQVTRRVDANWAEGKMGQRVGIFPINFVEMNSAAKTLIKMSSTATKVGPSPSSSGGTGSNQRMEHDRTGHGAKNMVIVGPFCDTNPSSSSSNPFTSMVDTMSHQPRTLPSKKHMKPGTSSIHHQRSKSHNMTSSGHPFSSSPFGSGSGSECVSPSVPFSLTSSCSSHNLGDIKDGGAVDSWIYDVPDKIKVRPLEPKRHSIHVPGHKGRHFKSHSDLESSPPPSSSSFSPNPWINTSDGSSTLRSVYVALYNYFPQKEDELQLIKGHIYCVTQKCADGWFKGYSIPSGVTGVFPGNYVSLDQKMSDCKPQEEGPSNGSSLNTTGILDWIKTSVTSSLLPKEEMDAPNDHSSGSKSMTGSPSWPHVKVAAIPEGKSSTQSPDMFSNGVTGSTCSKEKNSLSIIKNMLSTKKRDKGTRTVTTYCDNPNFEDTSPTSNPSSGHGHHIRSGSCPSEPINRMRSSSSLGTRESLPLPMSTNEVLALYHRPASQHHHHPHRPKGSDEVDDGVGDDADDDDDDGGFVQSKKLPSKWSKSKSSDNIQKQRYRCIIPYPANSDMELHLLVGDVVTVYKKRDDGWFKGVHGTSGKSGLFPSTFVQPI